MCYFFTKYNSSIIAVDFGETEDFFPMKDYHADMHWLFLSSYNISEIRICIVIDDILEKM